jgi:hypothetical protein
VLTYSPTNGSVVFDAWARIFIWVVPAAPADDSYAAQVPTSINAVGLLGSPFRNDFPAITPAALAAYINPQLL